MGPLSAIVIGLAAGVICYSACMIKSRFGYDDSLDVVGVHGVGGVFGALATGVFASKAINPAGADGLIYGNFALLKTQFIAVRRDRRIRRDRHRCDSVRAEGRYGSARQRGGRTYGPRPQPA